MRTLSLLISLALLRISLPLSISLSIRCAKISASLFERGGLAEDMILPANLRPPFSEGRRVKLAMWRSLTKRVQ
jgi:hypothetical protein